jgi:hypothetical protein
VLANIAATLDMVSVEGERGFALLTQSWSTR